MALHRGLGGCWGGGGVVPGSSRLPDRALGELPEQLPGSASVDSISKHRTLLDPGRVVAVIRNISQAPKGLAGARPARAFSVQARLFAELGAPVPTQPFCRGTKWQIIYIRKSEQARLRRF